MISPASPGPVPRDPRRLEATVASPDGPPEGVAVHSEHGLDDEGDELVRQNAYPQDEENLQGGVLHELENGAKGDVTAAARGDETRRVSEVNAGFRGPDGDVVCVWGGGEEAARRTYAVPVRTLMK